VSSLNCAMTCWSQIWPARIVRHSQIVLPSASRGRRHEPLTAALHGLYQVAGQHYQSTIAAVRLVPMTKDRRLTKSEDRVVAGQIKK